jgi:dTDP-4-amino-4,6-dideoxygalactose transaminase
MNRNTDFVPFALPSIGPEEEAAVLEVLRSGWLTTGKVAKAFEEEFASFVGARRALSVNSATSGLHLILDAFGVGPGVKVAMSPYTFASDAAVVRQLGGEVAFCDISREDYNLDPELLDELLAREPAIRVVVPVHIGGMPCRMGEILEIARRRGVRVVEDSAHGFPLRLAEGYAGTIGDAGFYSFYATKTITTGEGGMVVCRDEEAMKRMETMRLHGFDRTAWDRYTSKTASWRYDIVEPGYKYNLPDLLAAVGRAQLGKARRFLEERRAIAARYLEAFGGESAFEMPPLHPEHSWYLFSLRVVPEVLGIGRDEFAERLQASGIGVSVHFIPLHTMSYWSKRYGLKREDFPESYSKFSRTLSLPIWQGMSEAQVDRVIETALKIARERRAQPAAAPGPVSVGDPPRRGNL